MNRLQFWCESCKIGGFLSLEGQTQEVLEECIYCPHCGGESDSYLEEVVSDSD